MGRGQARPQRRTDEIVLGLPETHPIPCDHQSIFVRESETTITKMENGILM